MPRVKPLSRDDLPEFEPLFAMTEQVLGFVPNALLTLARRPDILRPFAALAASVMTSGRLDGQLKQLVAFVSSNAAGCLYCQAHTGHSASRIGVDSEKIAAAFEFETNPSFSERERAALSLARDASLVPNQVSGDHFTRLRKHFSEEEIVELVATVSLFGWFNRWNETMATELEGDPLGFARRTLAPHGWRPGEHAPASGAD